MIVVATGNGSVSYFLVTCTGDQARPELSAQKCAAVAVLGICLGVNQRLETALSLCLSAFQTNKSINIFLIMDLNVSNFIESMD